MNRDIDIIIQAYTMDHTRIDRGLYHWPKLVHARKIKKALSKEFDKMNFQIDHDRDPVAVGVIITVDQADASAFKNDLKTKFFRIAQIVESISAETQSIHISLMGTPKAGLKEIGIDTSDLFYNIAWQKLEKPMEDLTP